jgi:hypothetical protein
MSRWEIAAALTNGFSQTDPPPSHRMEISKAAGTIPATPKIVLLRDPSRRISKWSGLGSVIL